MASPFDGRYYEVGESVPLTDEDLRQDADLEWALRDPQVLDRYAGKVVAVADRKVWGTGDDHALALADALGKPDHPGRERLVFVPIPGKLPEDLSDQLREMLGDGPVGFVELTEEELRQDEDLDWAMSDPTVQDRYGGKVIAVAGRKVWGAGDDHTKALQAALESPGAPPRERLVFVPIPGKLPEDPWMLPE